MAKLLELQDLQKTTLLILKLLASVIKKMFEKLIIYWKWEEHVFQHCTCGSIALSKGETHNLQNNNAIDLQTLFLLS